VEKAGQTKDMAMEALKGTPVEVVLLIDPSPSACPSLRSWADQGHGNGGAERDARRGCLAH
jgi:hypothetical protein